MRKTSPIKQLKNVLPEETWPWAIPALRQDSFVWACLEDNNFIQLVVDKIGANPEAWSPINLALLNLDDTLIFDDTIRKQINENSSNLGEKAQQAFNEHLLRQDLRQAGLVALYLLSHPEIPYTTLWKTSLACLFGLVTDQVRLLSQLNPKSSVHVLLSNPLPNERQNEIISQLIIHSNTKYRIRFLQELSSQRAQTATRILKGLKQNNPELFDNSKISDWNNPLLSNLALLLTDTEFQSIADDKDDYLVTINKAWKESEIIKNTLAIQIIEVYLANKLFNKAREIWSANQSRFTSQQITKIFLTLNYHGFTKEGVDWFAGEIRNFGLDKNDADLCLAFGIIAHNSGDLRLAREAAQYALNNYTQSKSQNIRHIKMLTKLFQALNQPEYSLGAIDLALAVNPNNLEAIILSVEAFQAAGKPEHAIQAAHLAIALAPHPIELRRKLAQTLENDGQWVEALRERETILDLQEKPELTDFYEMVTSALMADQPQQAASGCQKILARYPENAEAFRLLGEAYVLLGDPIKAQEFLIKAVDNSPQSASAWISLSNHYRRTNQPNKIKETLHEASSANPENPEIQYTLGTVYWDENALTQALSSFQLANRLAEQQEGTINKQIRTGIAESLGQTLLKLGHVEEAQKHLEHGYKMDPNHIGIAHNYAKTLHVLGEKEKALQILSDIRYKAQNNPDVLLDFARINILEQKNLGEVEETLYQVLKISPDCAEANALLAETHELNEDYGQALDAYQNALNSILQQDPTWNSKLSLGLGRVSLKLGQPEIAIAALKGVDVREHEDLVILKTLASAYQAADLGDQAWAVTKASLEITSNDEGQLDWFVQQSINLEKTDDAIIILNQFLKEEGNKTPYLINLGWLYLYEDAIEMASETFSKIKSFEQINSSDLYKASQGFLAMGDVSNAIESLERAICMSESAAEIELLPKLYFTKSVAYQNDGNLDRALEAIEEAIALSPEDPDLIEKKSQILIDKGEYEAAKKCVEDSIENIPLSSSLRIYAILINRHCGDLMNAAFYAKGLLSDSNSEIPDRIELSISAILADLADAMLQPTQARKIIEAAISNGETSPADLTYHCIAAELALNEDEEIAAANSLTDALKIDPDHPRVLALQARITSRHGDFNSAKQILQKGLETIGNFPVLGPTSINSEELTALSLANHSSSTYIALAEACIIFQQWSVANFLLQKAIDISPNEPRSHFKLSRALVLRAEYQRICQILEVVNQAPGQAALAGYAYQNFEEAILKTAQLVTHLSPDSESGLLGQDESKSMISMWLARGQAVFRPSLEHVKALEVLPEISENRAAYISALMSVNEKEKASKVALQTYENPGIFPPTPSLLGQIALALSEESPFFANQAIKTSIEMSAWFNTPNHPIYLAIQAHIAQKNKDFEQQLQSLRAALDVWTDEPVWLEKASNILINQNQDLGIQTAIEYLERAIQLDPKKAENYLKLADAYSKQANLDQVIQILEKATHSLAKQPELWLALARAYHQDGDIPQAIRCAKNVTQMDSSQTDANMLLAEVALAVDNPEQASQHIHEVLEVDPNNQQALHLNAKIWKALNNPEEALAALDKVIEIQPDSLPLLLERAALIRESQGEEKAIVVLQGLKDDHPHDPHVLASLAETLSALGDQKAAVHNAQEALNLSRGSMEGNEYVELLQLLGRLLRKSGQLDQAIHILSEAVQVAPDVPGPYIQLGRCYQEQRQYDKALQNLHHAISINPDDSKAYYISGLVFKDCKDYENAEIMFKKANNLEPNDLNIYRQLGAVTAINLVQNRQKKPNQTIAVESTDT